MQRRFEMPLRNCVDAKNKAHLQTWWILQRNGWNPKIRQHSSINCILSGFNGLAKAKEENCKHLVHEPCPLPSIPSLIEKSFLHLFSQLLQRTTRSFDSIAYVILRNLHGILELRRGSSSYILPLLPTMQNFTIHESPGLRTTIRQSWLLLQLLQSIICHSAGLPHCCRWKRSQNRESCCQYGRWKSQNQTWHLVKVPWGSCCHMGPHRPTNGFSIWIRYRRNPVIHICIPFWLTILNLPIIHFDSWGSRSRGQQTGFVVRVWGRIESEDLRRRMQWGCARCQSVGAVCYVSSSPFLL